MAAQVHREIDVRKSSHTAYQAIPVGEPITDNNNYNPLYSAEDTSSYHDKNDNRPTGQVVTKEIA